jgi:uncharacterized membrane protein YedE/YeeE
MAIYWEPVEVGMAILGGAFIALATTLNLLIMGRITGMSGMFFTVFRLRKSEGLVWKFCGVMGIVFVPFMFYYLGSRHIDINGYSYRVLDDQSQATQGLDIAGWIVGGLLVGFGTKLGNGCTSGHGVCGIPRLSLRSLVAVMTFMSTAVGIATLRFYEPFFDKTDTADDTLVEGYQHFMQALMGLLILCVDGLAVYALVKHSQPDLKYDPVISFFIGSIFGIGLLISGMCRRTKIQNFLSLGDGWDPSLIFVMASAVSINLVTFHFIIKDPHAPLLKPECELPKKKNLDWRVVVGPAIFGLGWGISGFCPGPGMVNLFLITHCGLFMVSLAIGQLIAHGLVLYLDRPRIVPPLT